MKDFSKTLEKLSASQTPHVAGWHPRPFHANTGEFRSGRNREELSAQQPGQIIRIPAPKRNPPILGLGPGDRRAGRERHLRQI
jgi:hypothetical protein